MQSRQNARASSSGDLQARQQGSPGQRAPARRSSSYNMGDSDISGEASAESTPAVLRQSSFDAPPKAAKPVPAKTTQTQRPEADFLGFGSEAEGPAELTHASSQPSKPPTRKPDVTSPEDDLLNMSGEAPQTAERPQRAAAPAGDEDDLLGSFSRAPAVASAQKQQASSSPHKSTAAAEPAAVWSQKPAADEDDLLGGFSHAPAAASAQKQQPARAPPKSTADTDIESLFGGQPPSQHRAGGSMIDFGDEAASKAAHVFADPGDADVEGEPEVSPFLLPPKILA